MNISDEAVEAAAKALYPEVREEWRVPPAPWESLSEDDEDARAAVALARIALEAAAPYMQPEVSTEEELDAAPIGTVVMSADQRVFLKDDIRGVVSFWTIPNAIHYFRSEDVSMPAQVLHNPNPYRSQA